MQTSSWNVATVRPAKVDETVKALRARGAQVVNFRRQERVPTKLAHRQVRWDMGERPMFPGYIFLRGFEAIDLETIPFPPRLLRVEGAFQTLSAARLAHLQFLIGHEELLSVRAMQYIEGDRVKYRDFTATIQKVKNLADGQVVTLNYKAFGKTSLVDVASQEVRLEAEQLLAG